MPVSELHARPFRMRAREQVGARIVGIGSAQPDRRVSGAELTERFGKDAGWLRDRTGIEEVRRIEFDETLLDLATTAAQAALADAGEATVDVVVVASCSIKAGPQASLAQQVAARVAPDAFSIDLNAACSGFVYAISTAADMIRGGEAQRVLVVGAEHMSRLIDPKDLGTSILFADGAGAAVVSVCAADEDGCGLAAFFSDGDSRDVLTIPAGRTTLDMDGQAVFRWAVSTVPDLIHRALTRARLTSGEIEVFLPHQANARITDAIRRKAGLEHAVSADNVRCSGNTSAASIPIALDALRRRVNVSGKLAVVAGFGAGLSSAAQVLVLP